jgi:hypothetical protein
MSRLETRWREPDGRAETSEQRWMCSHRMDVEFVLTSGRRWRSYRFARPSAPVAEGDRIAVRDLKRTARRNAG